MTDLPQWAVEKADDLFDALLECVTETSEGVGLRADARDIIARALADAAKPKWRTDMENIPDNGEQFVVGDWVSNTHGEKWWEAYVIHLDDETCEIDGTYECPWSIADFTHWLPLPDAPEVE